MLQFSTSSFSSIPIGLVLSAILTTPHVVGSSRSSSKSSSSFLWLSDIHLDPYYGQNITFGSNDSNDINTNPQCTDVESNSTKMFGQMGCDSPPTLLHSALNEAVPLFDKDVSFVIITGDLSRHDTDELDNPVADTEEILKKVSDHLKTSFPDVTIIPALGNNDVTPDYYLDTTLDNNNNPLLDMVSNGLAPLLETDEERATFKKGGYFARNVSDSLTVISLNTVIYSTSHEPPTGDDDCINSDDENTIVDPNDENYNHLCYDPLNQFQWLEQQLYIAQNTSHSVYIIGHIPPTVGSYRHSQLWKDRFLNRYYQLVSKDYPDLVKGHLFGHLHSDEFRIPVHEIPTWNNDTNSTEFIMANDIVLWLAPSITPIYGSNPSIRLSHYETDTGELLDYDTYYLDLKRSDTDTVAEWKESSSFRDAYRVSDLSRKSMEKIVTELSEKPFSPLWKVLLSRQHVYADDDDDECDQICQKEWLCTFQTTTKEDYSECLVTEGTSSSGSSGGTVGIIIVAILVLIVIGGVVLNMGGPVRFLKRLGYQEATMSPIDDEDYDEDEDYEGNDHDHDNDNELPAEKHQENGLV